MASLTLIILAGTLISCGAYLVTERTLTRVVIGLGLLTHGVNLLILASGGASGSAALLGHNEVSENGISGLKMMADPLPQAMMLTAIVIGLGTTAFGMALAYRSYLQVGHDEVVDDIEDRLVAKRMNTDTALTDATTGDEDPTICYDSEHIESTVSKPIFAEVLARATRNSMRIENNPRKPRRMADERDEL